MMEKENVDALKRIRDQLSFVIFALSSKKQYHLKFSDEEERGLKEILGHIALNLNKVSEGDEAEGLDQESSDEATSDSTYHEPSQF
jgi:hypothetical protein